MFKFLKSILITILTYVNPSQPFRDKSSLPGEELVHRILEYFAKPNLNPIPPSAALETIRHFRHQFGTLNSNNLGSFLHSVSEFYHVRLNFINRSLKDIQDYMTPDAPFLILVPDQKDRLPRVYFFLSFHASAYKVLNLITEEEEWLSDREVFTILNIKSANDKVKWITSDPLYAFSKPVLKVKESDRIRDAFAQIYHLMHLENRDIWIIIIYGIGMGILSLVIPIATSTLVNIVSFGILLQPVIVLTFLVAFFLGFAGAMQIIQTYVIEILERRVFVRIATEFASKFPKIKQEALDSFHKPELANRFFDTMTVQKSINLLLVDGLAVALTSVIGFILIGIYHPVFILFDIVVLFVGCYFLIYKMGKPACIAYLSVSKQKYKVAAWIQEISRHTTIFHSKFGTDFGLRKADEITHDYLAAREKYFKYSIRQIIGLITLQTIASAVVLGIGGYLVIKRELTIGQLVAAEFVIAKVLNDISKFGKQLDSFYGLIAAVDKIDYVLQLPVIVPGNNPYYKTNKPMAIEVSHLSYTLPDDRNIFTDFSLSLTSGSITGITSKSPYQSNILLDLLTAIRIPNYGIISYDKQDLHETDYHLNYDDTLLVRGNEIFEGSILENLKMGRERVSSIEIRELLEKFGLWSMIQKMPSGLHTHLLTFGHPLDSIQTAVLQITRAVLGEPRFLLIDGTLDSLPEEYLIPITEYLFRKDRPWTLVVATKSPSILARMDQVLSLDSDSKTLKFNKRKGG